MDWYSTLLMPNLKSMIVFSNKNIIVYYPPAPHRGVCVGRLAAAYQLILKTISRAFLSCISLAPHRGVCEGRLAAAYPTSATTTLSSPFTPNRGVCENLSKKPRNQNNNRSGFLTMESLAALSIIAIFMTTLMVIQTGSLTRVIKAARSLDRFFILQEFYQQAQRKEENPEEQFSMNSIDELHKLELTYTLKPIAKNSPVSSIPDLLQEEIRVKSSQKNNPAQETIKLFIYRKKLETKDNQSLKK